VEKSILPVSLTGSMTADGTVPAVVEEAGSNARFAYEEFFTSLDSPHTVEAYRRDLHRFLAHVHDLGLSLHQVTPKLVRAYIDNLKPLKLSDPPLSAPTKKRVLAAVRKFFDFAVIRHAVPLNPALSVRGPKHAIVEGKTQQITVEQARRLLRSIDTSNIVGLRDRAILATLIYTGARVGAVAKLRTDSFYSDGEQFWFRFHEKGGKSREIPCRHDLQRIIRQYLDAAGESGIGPLFRSVLRREGRLTHNVITAGDICRMVKRRVKAACLSLRISPHSFRVTVATDLLNQNVPLEDVQYLLGHADARTTKLYDRRKRQITRNLVERISV
jgi:site-specific recombinase XerD